MKRLLVLWALMAGLNPLVQAQSDIFNPMRDAIKAGDAAELVKSFAPSVDFELEGNSNTYSKAQSEFVLKEFFKKHPVTDFSIKHKGGSNGGLQFAIGSYVSGSNTFTVLMRVRQVGDVYLVHEISFVKSE